MDFSHLADTLYFSTFIDSVEEKRLLLPDSLYLGEAAQVYFEENHIWVVDWRQNCIFRFDSEGCFMNCIYRLGEGPEEYQRINKLWVQDDKLYIHDNKGLKVNVYTVDGELRESIRCEHPFSDIEPLADDTFLCYTADYIHEHPTGLWFMDRHGKHKASLLSYDQPFPAVSHLWKFFYRTPDGGIGLFASGTDCFYAWTKDTLNTLACIDCVQPTPASLQGISSCWEVKEDFYTLPWFVDGSRWLFMCYAHFKGNEAYYALHSKEKGETLIYQSISVDVGRGKLLGSPVCSNRPDCLVTLSTNEDLSMIYEMMGNDEAAKQVEATLSSLWMKIYHFKKRTT